MPDTLRHASYLLMDKDGVHASSGTHLGDDLCTNSDPKWGTGQFTASESR
jgi:hypothetical protein